MPCFCGQASRGLASPAAKESINVPSRVADSVGSFYWEDRRWVSSISLFSVPCEFHNASKLLQTHLPNVIQISFKSFDDLAHPYLAECSAFAIHLGLVVGDIRCLFRWREECGKNGW